MKKLEGALLRCDLRVRYLAAPDHVPSEADRCLRCGEFHILVIEEVIVERVSDEIVPAAHPAMANT